MSLHNQNILGATIETGEITNGSVTTDKIADLAVTLAKIANACITNAKIDAAAAIAYSKLALTGAIVNADIAAAAAIALSKLDKTGMTTSKVLGYDGANIAPVDMSGFYSVLGAADLSGGAADSITVSGLTNLNTYMVIAYLSKTGTNIQCVIRFNGDTGNNYTVDTNRSGTEYSASGVSGLYTTPAEDGDHVLLCILVHNISTIKKSVTWYGFSGNGYIIGGGFWGNTTDAISSITIANVGAGDFDTPTKMRVAGRNI